MIENGKILIFQEKVKLADQLKSMKSPPDLTMRCSLMIEPNLGTLPSFAYNHCREVKSYTKQNKHKFLIISVLYAQNQAYPPTSCSSLLESICSELQPPLLDQMKKGDKAECHLIVSIYTVLQSASYTLFSAPYSKPVKEISITIHILQMGKGKEAEAKKRWLVCTYCLYKPDANQGIFS